MPYNFDTLKAVCALLVDNIIDGGYLDSYCDSKVVVNVNAIHKEHQFDREREIVRDFRKDMLSLTKQYQHAGNTGH